MKETKTFPDDTSFSLLDSLYEILNEEDILNNLNCLTEECKETYYIPIRKQFKGHELEERLVSKQKLKNVDKCCKCPNCGETIYLIDYLRLHELIDENLGSSSILGRLTNVIEHLFPINFIMNILNLSDYEMAKEYRYLTISKTAYLVDGPLAIYGEPAKLNRAIHRYLNKVNKDLIDQGLQPLVYMGISKTGTIVDYVQLLLNHIKNLSTEKNIEIALPTEKFMLIDDGYRFKYIQPKMNNNLFGAETYYGQDIVYFNKLGNHFVLSVLYPFVRTDDGFKSKIFDVNNYTNLGRIGNLIEDLKVDVYDSALLPIVLAHKYASISLKPGTSSLKDFAKAIVSQ